MKNIYHQFPTFPFNHTWNIATHASPMLSNETPPWNGFLSPAVQFV